MSARVEELERYLLQRFPREDAESWDHVGMSVGFPEAGITGVCCALDATERAVREACGRGANVLLTHHPVYLSAPSCIAPASRTHPACGSAVLAAASCGMSIISLHTNLDRSLEARSALPALLGLTPRSSLEHPDAPERHGLGALCECGCTLQALAGRAATAFGTDPRVWGDPGWELHRIALIGGSLGGLGDAALSCGADAVICGEAGYHRAQDAYLRGCSVIELGHDRSEEPFCSILAAAAIDAGIPAHSVSIIPGAAQWWTVREGELS